MISPLLLILICSLTALGIHYAARFENYDDFDAEPGSTERISWEVRYGMNPQGREIFWWLRFYGDRLPRMMHKPLYSCPICMASVYSIVPVVLFCIALGLAWWIVPVVYVVTVPVVAGLNLLLVYNLNIS